MIRWALLVGCGLLGLIWCVVTGQYALVGMFLLMLLVPLAARGTPELAVAECSHVHTVPVTLAVTGERVGSLCADCDLALP